MLKFDFIYRFIIKNIKNILIKINIFNSSLITLFLKCQSKEKILLCSPLHSSAPLLFCFFPSYLVCLVFVSFCNFVCKLTHSLSSVTHNFLISVFNDDDDGEHHDNRRGTFCGPLIDNVITNQSKCHSNETFPRTNNSVSCY
jgi:hypothetical protein